jgi:hypothetical protein
MKKKDKRGIFWANEGQKGKGNRHKQEVKGNM